jgi:hypothetical protein
MRPMRARPTLIVLLASAALALPGPAHARAERDLWATVNVCDTTAFPDTMGVRASMPGTKPRRRLLMRFSAQFYDVGEGAFVRTVNRSRWLRVGKGGSESIQSGFDFRFDAPPVGSSFTLRGVVDFRWMGRRKGRWRVVKRATKITRAGIRDVEDADPPGYSRAVCQIKTP